MSNLKLVKQLSPRKMREYYESDEFKRKQAELDLIHSSKQQTKPDTKNKVWLLWITFNPKYPKAGEGIRLDGVYKTEESVNKRVSELERYVYISEYRIQEEDIKA